MTHETATGIVALAACWMFGGLHGLTLAWTQPARMRAWAARVEWAWVKVYGDADTVCGLLCDSGAKSCGRPDCSRSIDEGGVTSRG